MKSEANNIDTYEWWRSQPKDKWLEIKNIPFCIFWSIWNLKIESNQVELHPVDSKYKKVLRSDGKKYASIKEAALKNKINRSTIYRAIRFKLKRAGYYLEYA